MGPHIIFKKPQPIYVITILPTDYEVGVIEVLYKHTVNFFV